MRYFGIGAFSTGMLLFTPEEDPLIIHAPSGAWTQDDTWPLAGLQAPNTVWNGERLVVWGGTSTPTESIQSPADGAIWTPPRR